MGQKPKEVLTLEGANGLADHLGAPDKLLEEDLFAGQSLGLHGLL